MGVQLQRSVIYNARSFRVIPARTIVALFVAATAACSDAPTKTPASHPESSFLSFRSESGDYIGQGETRRHTLADAQFSVDAPVPSGSGAAVIHVFVTGGTFWWTLRLEAPAGQALAAGAYEGARRFQGPAQPGVDFGGNSRGCNETTGRFVIHYLVLGPNRRVDRLHATFEQHCEGMTPALHGEISIVANPWR